MANKVVVFCLHKRFRRFRGGVKRAALGTLSSLEKDGKYLEIYLVSDRLTRSLNLKFRGKDKPADVLSFGNAGGFPEPDLPRGVKRLGEVYLAPDYVRRKGGVIERLTAHGILHLLGYTHKEALARDKPRGEMRSKPRKQARGKMEREENRICKALNF